MGTVNRVLVVGAGIAGLSAAIALGRAGMACDLVELHDHTDGASIGLTARAVYALEALGVLDACKAAGRSLEGPVTIFSTLYDGHGDPLPIPPMPPRQDVRLPAAVSLYRPVLARILREAAHAAGASLRLGISVAALQAHADAVDVRFTDGSSARYDLVIGADGIRSVVRGMIHGDGIQPQYTGHMSLRTMFHGSEAAYDGKTGFFNAGHDTVAVVQLPGDLTYLVTGLELPLGQVSPADAQQHLRNILARFSYPPLQALRDRIGAGQQVLVRPYEWLLVPAPWHRGRITLIGDAAHATTAHLSSGGGMALEDAVVLAEELQRHDSAEAALQAFMARRMDRVKLVVETSVELVRLQQQGADPRAMGMLRGRAMASLAMPF